MNCQISIIHWDLKQMTKLKAVSFQHSTKWDFYLNTPGLVKYKALFVTKHLLCKNIKYNAYDEGGTKQTVDYVDHFHRRPSVRKNINR